MPIPCPHRALAPIIAAPFFFAAVASGQGTLYFSDTLNFTDPDGNSIRAINTDGSGLHTIVPTGGGVRGIDLDVAHNYVYWTDTDNFAIRRAHLDGTGQEDLITSGLGFPSALRLDLANQKMYWGDQTNEEIHRSDLDGSNNETIASTSFFRGLALTPSTIYWTTSVTATTGRIITANPDGSNQQVLVPPVGSAFKPGSLALDTAIGKIFWTDPVADVIRSANLDGSNVQTLYNAAAFGAPKGITIDLAAGKIYWGQDIESEGSVSGQIMRMNLDGSSPELVAAGLGSVFDLVFVPVPAPGSAFLFAAAAGLATRRRRR